MSKKSALFALLPLVLIAAATLRAQQPPPTVVEVYKTSTCGCCSKWVEHLKQNGFTVKATDVADINEVKVRNGVPSDAASCHTALVGGYVVEGHVPAASVRRLLRERPAVVGIAVPGMPIGSPGMEGPNPEAYDVVSFDKAGTLKVYQSIRPN